MKICIIGSCGHWQYALSQLPKHTVVGIAPGYKTEDMRSVKETLKSVGIEAEMYNDYKRLLLSAEIAIVNTRFDLNAEVTAECLKRNIFVFSEKPLALNLKQLEMLEQIERNSKAFVTAMFAIRYSSWFLTLKESLKDIGEIRLLNATKSYKLGIRPQFFKSQNTFGGIIPWVSIHAIDWVYSLTQAKFKYIDAVTDSNYNSGNGDLEMTSLCQFEMENGILASVTADYFRPQAAPTHDDDRIRVVGTQGIAEYSNGIVQITDQTGVTCLTTCRSQDVFELFLRRVNGEDVGVTPDESFYITEISLKARDAAVNKKSLNQRHENGYSSVCSRR